MATQLAEPWKYYATLDDAYALIGRDTNPAVGTINEKLGFDQTNPTTKRYTKPIINKDSTADYTTDTVDGFTTKGEPIPGTVVGTEQGCYVKFDGDCPTEDLPAGRITNAAFEATGWLPTVE